ncbi:hypothetical protein [Streptomyces griseorubiginosus]|uniref:Uncharacterized protein n=1 Tax=Streptomyces griseorubiginosus TaxID=67304 RepID=A0AAI8L108_9ACTN|nr:hypothetical protein [Streptomyces griseorubiginosus]AYC39645.1 hypothetical protein DWG14_03887 [Streptomyces griseorubiginosus]
MNPSESSPEIDFSPAAAAAIDGAVDEYRLEVRYRAQELASFGGAIRREVGVTEVFKAISDTAQSIADPTGRNRRLSRLVAVTITVSLIYGFFGALLLVTNIDSSVGTLRYLGYFFMGALLPTAPLSAAFLMRRSRASLLGPRSSRLSDEEIDPFDTLRVWTDIENVIRERVSSEFGESVAGRSPMKLISIFADASSLSAHEVDELRNMLQVRNKVAHGQQVDQREVASVMRNARRLLSRLKSASLSGNLGPDQ